MKRRPSKNVNRLVAFVREHEKPDAWLWVAVGPGMFHRKVIERALAQRRLVMLSSGYDYAGDYGFQLATPAGFAAARA